MKSVFKKLLLAEILIIGLTLIFDIGIINKGTVEWEHLLCLNDSNSFLSFLLF